MESRIQKDRPFGIWNPLRWNIETSTWDPEYKTAADNLTGGDTYLHYFFTKICLKSQEKWSVQEHLGPLELIFSY